MANKTKGNKNISDIYPKQRVSFPAQKQED